MTRRRWRALKGGLACLALASPLSAQVGVVIHGRVEDAVSREPVAGARVFAADSSFAVYTDSVGTFYIPLPAEGPFAIQAERLGYLSQQFDLEGDASRISILRPEPSPIQLEGFTVEEAAALTELVENLERRRNFYPSTMRAFDRTLLERFGTGESVLDFVRTRKPWIIQCDSDLSQMCVRGRGRSFRNLNPQNPVLVCVDGFRSFSPFLELASLSIQSVALVELYGSRGSQVRVYTAHWMASRARKGRTNVVPLFFGC